MRGTVNVDFQANRRMSCIGVPQLTTEKFPNDLDTTSVALSVLPIDKKVVASVMDEMLEFRSADGIFMVSRSPF